MLIHLGQPRRSIAIDYRERAPAAIAPDTYERLGNPTASQRGGYAVGVPGTVAGLLLALEEFGTLDRATVMAPAIRAAEEGFASTATTCWRRRRLARGSRRTPRHGGRNTRSSGSASSLAARSR